MPTWSEEPRRRSGGRGGLAAARDVAIIAVCVVILAFALLAFLGTPRDAPPRAPQPAARIAL